MKKTRFKGTVTGGHKGAAIELPFEPDQAFRVTIDGRTFDGIIARRQKKCWLLVDGLDEGEEVDVVLRPVKPPDFEPVRELCFSLPDVEEKISHGAPTFFASNRVFVMYAANHHGDGRFALWCNAAEGAQEMLVASDPENFFVPPYVGVYGWIGMRIDRGLSKKTISSVVKDAYAEAMRKNVIRPRRKQK